MGEKGQIMHKLKFLFLNSFVLMLSINCAMANIGQVTLLKGAAFANEAPLKKGDILHIDKASKIRTAKAAILHLRMSDAAQIILAPETEINIVRYSNSAQSIDNYFKLIKGKIRVSFKEKLNPDHKIRIDSQLIVLSIASIGETQFISSAYDVGGAPSTDTLLLKGSLEVSGAGFEPFTLNRSQYFNSQEIVKAGNRAIRKINYETLTSLREDESEFFIQLQTDTGFRGLHLSTPLTKEKKEEREKAIAKIMENRQKRIRKVQKKAQVQKVSKSDAFKYDIEKEPLDIQEILKNRKNNKAQGQCFAFTYRKVPGSGEPQRFRRERNCDEFEYNL